MNDWRFDAKAEDKQLGKLIKKPTKHLLYPSFCRSGIWVWLSRFLWLRFSNKTAIKVLAAAGVTSGLQWEKIQFQDHSCGCWQDWVSCMLLDWGLQLFSGCRPEATSSPCWMDPCLGHLTTWQLQLYQSSSEQPGRGLTRQKSQHFVMGSWKWHPITLATFCSLEQVTRSNIHSRGGDCARAWIPGDGGLGDGNFWGPQQKLPTTKDHNHPYKSSIQACLGGSREQKQTESKTIGVSPVVCVDSWPATEEVYLLSWHYIRS